MTCEAIALAITLKLTPLPTLNLQWVNSVEPQKAVYKQEIRSRFNTEDYTTNTVKNKKSWWIKRRYIKDIKYTLTVVLYL